MLASLFIKNYLLIENLNLDFNNGFSVITGETGAGKSIIIDAMSLICGKRADSSIIRKNQDKCIIEVTFNIKNSKLESFFENEDIDYSDITSIRREINSNGKSRAFINDSPVTLNKLEILSEKLFHLHSQNENFYLNNPIFRLNFIDKIANTKNILEKFQSKYNIFINLSNTIKEKTKLLEKLNAEKDFNKFQLEELKNAKLENNNELEELESQEYILENAEEIKKNIFQTTTIINNSDNSLLSSIKEIKNLLSHISKNYKNAENYLKRIEEINEELKDIYYSLEKENTKIDINSEELEKIISRINLINNLLQKHNCKNISEIKQKQEYYYQSITNTEDLEDEIKTLKQEISKLNSEIIELGNELSKQRMSVFANIENETNKILIDLGMPFGKFKIENQKSENYTITGFDNINFLFSANKDITPDLIEKVASGGEFSRLMLALNFILAKTKALETIIFDEIDSGVSGEIANKMGKIMKQISKFSQVISITHLPQIAAIGDYHYKVYKIFDNNQTTSNIIEIKEENRIQEIASMISGEKLSKEAIENAKILLKN